MFLILNKIWLKYKAYPSFHIHSYNYTSFLISYRFISSLLCAMVKFPFLTVHIHKSRAYFPYRFYWQQWQRTTNESIRQPFCQKFQNKNKVARSVIESEFRTSKMGAGGHFVKSDLNNVPTDWYKFTFGQNIYRQVWNEGIYIVFVL